MYTCLLAASPACSNALTTSEQEVFPDLLAVPKEYLDLKPVFSKAHATSLPPPRPYNRAAWFFSSQGKAVLSLGSRMPRHE